MSKSSVGARTEDSHDVRGLTDPRDLCHLRTTMWDSKRKQLVVAAVVTVLVLTFHRPIHHQGTPATPAQCPSTSHPTFVEGTLPVLIRNAKILTGARNGTEVVFGDVLPDKGVVLGIGYIPHALTHPPPKPTSVYSAPALDGASDGNSIKAPILPWLRSLDGLNTTTRTVGYRGGVTTAQILPGSANNIGGQAFLIKLRPTAEHSASAMLLDPPASTPPTTAPSGDT
ncbi:hypothetical protein B0H13DRAFT_2370146 [Mycena leptocephala]|nr:hypothetical protein B0H13DRAFT_2370146 [Mycena leptocephala]